MENHLADLGLNGRIILLWILNIHTRCEGLNRVEVLRTVRAVDSILVPQQTSGFHHKRKNFLLAKQLSASKEHNDIWN